jgi:putative peptidoglycan lipid II flippase
MNRYWKFIFIFSLILLGKVSGFVKDILITFYHGVSAITDAYFLSNSISSVLYIAIYCAIPVLIVPLYSRLLVEEKRVRINRELSAAMFFLLSLSVCVAVFVFGAAHWLVDLFAGAIDQRVKEFAVSYLSIMTLTFALSTLVSFYNSIQTVNKIVIPSYVVPIVNNFVFCVGLYIFHSAVNFDKVLMLGVLGWGAVLLINYFISRKSFSFEFGAAFAYFTDKKFIFLFLPAVISFYVEQVNGFVGIYFASKLGLGAISIFGYSNKLNMIFLSVFLVFLTASLFPRIAAVSAKNDQVKLFRYLIGCIRIIVICAVPVVIYMNFYSTEIVELLFHRGNFTATDVIKVASVFSVALLAVPFCLIRDIMNRVFFSHGNTLTPVLLSLAALTINYALSYILYQQYAVVGLAASAVASTLFNCLVVVLLVQRRTTCNLFLPCLKVLTLCCVGGVTAYFPLSWLNNTFPRYWLLLSVPFFLIYFLCLLVLRIQEAHFVIGGRIKE